MQHKIWWPGIAFALLIVTLLAACTPAAAPATPTPQAAKPTAAQSTAAVPATPTTPPAKAAASPTPVPATVKVGVVHATSAGGLYYAIEKGYFAEQGITVDLQGIASLTDMTAPLTRGDLDIGAGGLASSVFNAFERGIDLRIIGGYIVFPEGDKFGMWLVRKDLAGQIKEYSDLKGKKIATTSKGSIGELRLHKALEKGGLTIKDVEYVPIGFSDAVTALANKSIDVANSTEPYVTKAVAMGAAVAWKPSWETTPNYLSGVFVASPKFLSEKRDVANRFMVAYLKGVRGYMDVFFKNKGDREGVLAALAKYSGINDRALLDQMAPAYLEPDGFVDVKNLYEQMDWYIKNGYVTKRVPLEPLVDTGPLDYAVKLLGKYQ